MEIINFKQNYIKNKNFKYNDLTFNDIGRINIMLEYITRLNEIKINNRKDSILKINDLNKLLNLSEKRLMQYLNKMQSKNFLKYFKIDEKTINVFINPMYAKHCEFEWNIDIFTMFDTYLQEKISHTEYLSIKSTWYEINNDFKLNSLNDVPENISAVYRLFKNHKVVYVGKSINVKNRIKDHTKDKDFDYFDFSIMNNESNKNLYEIYYIDKYKPLYNKECVENSISDIELEDLIFIEKIYLDK